MSLTLTKGKPDCAGKLDKEIRVYELLDKLGIEYELVEHGAVDTIEECREIDEALNTQICKNLFLCNNQKTKFYLLILPGEKKFKTAAVSKQIGSSRLSFADGEYMEKYLDITPGAVSIMGLMNDNDNNVQLLVDKDLLNNEYYACHPCVNTASLKLKTSDVLGKFLDYVHHEATFVEL